MFQQATATCHKNKITVYFESYSSFYTHGNEASVYPSTEATEATIHNIPVQRSVQLSYEANYAGSWSFVGSNEPVSARIIAFLISHPQFYI